MSKYKKYDQDILMYHSQGLNNKEIGLKINLDSRRVSDRLVKNNKNSLYTNKNKELSINGNYQKQILLGTVIGDGCLFKAKANINYRMNLAHSLKQEIYFNMKYNVLKDLVNSEPKKRSWIDKRTLKTYSEIKLQSLTNPLFTKLYHIWYKDGKKIIPKKEIFELDELGLAIKYFDDGHARVDKNYNISMYDYDKVSIENFRYFLLKKFNIETSLQSRNNIYIGKQSRDKFKSIIKKYATSDVLYKLGELTGNP